MHTVMVIGGGSTAAAATAALWFIPVWILPSAINMKHGSLSQLQATMSLERLGSTKKGELTFQYRPRVPRDHAELLNETEFLNVIGLLDAEPGD